MRRDHDAKRTTARDVRSVSTAGIFGGYWSVERMLDVVERERERGRGVERVCGYSEHNNDLRSTNARVQSLTWEKKRQLCGVTSKLFAPSHKIQERNETAGMTSSAN